MLRRSLLLLAISAPAWAAEPCCGAIGPGGERLATLLDSLDVEHRWLAHQHVNWETGEADRSAEYAGPAKSTHCSAFAAAVGARLGVYMLRPPQHGQNLLASAQTRWFASPAGQAAGWRAVDGMQTAQILANQGELVVISYESPNPKTPGHIVIVRPSLKTAAQFAIEGPLVIQAATRNSASRPAATSFNAHPGAWPNGVRVFAHTVPAPL
jgi:hypothetical protein